MSFIIFNPYSSLLNPHVWWFLIPKIYDLTPHWGHQGGGDTCLQGHDVAGEIARWGRAFHAMGKPWHIMGDIMGIFPGKCISHWSLDSISWHIMAFPISFWKIMAYHGDIPLKTHGSCRNGGHEAMVPWSWSVMVVPGDLKRWDSLFCKAKYHWKSLQDKSLLEFRDTIDMCFLITRSYWVLLGFSSRF